MKKVTCKEMGGVCDEVITGDTPEEVAKKGYGHLASVNDETHNKMREMVDNSSEEVKQRWMEEFRRMFEDAPEV